MPQKRPIVPQFRPSSAIRSAAVWPSPLLRRDFVSQSLQQAVKGAQRLLRSAIHRFRPRHVVALFSGGHDSLVATHIASSTKQFRFALHINTGIGIPATRDFVLNTCARLLIPLREYRASDYRTPKGDPRPQRYADLVKERGFPGPAMHTKMYNRLKERPLRQMFRDLDRLPKDKVLLVTGVRSKESLRRLRHVEPLQMWEGTKVWVAPLWRFSKEHINEYVEREKLPRNLVVDLLHKSGECLCGAFAHPGEKEEIRFWFPEVARRLDLLEEEVRACGFEWGWGQRPPRRNRNARRANESILCASCIQDGTI